MPEIYDGFDGAGVTLAFATSGFECKVKSFTEPAQSVGKLEYTGVADDTKTWKAGTVTENGDLALTIFYDPNERPPLGVTDTITITFPVPTGHSAGTILTITGFFYNFEPGANEAGAGGLIEATVTIAVNTAVVTPAVVIP